MGKNNTDLLKIAQKHLGEGGAKFRKFCNLPAGAPYCNAFVDYIANEGGDSSLFFDGKRPTYCPDSIKWCNKNLALIPLYLALPMDIIYFDWERNGVPNHIGFVRSKKSTSVIYTIEGNTDKKDKNGKTVSHNVVAERTRDGKYVQGVYRPHFPAKYTLQKLAIDGDFGYNSIANLQRALKINVDGILGKGTVQALQKRAGLSGKSVDGAFGPATARAVQKMVGAKPIDGEFGPNSVRKLQEWINNINYPATNKKPSETKTEAPASKPTTYSGPFPDLVTHSGQIIAYTARDLAYAKGTKKATYTYPKGKAKASFTKAINIVYPKRSSWSKQCQAGASCDVGAGTIIRYSGTDTKVPRGLQEQIPHFKKSSLWKNTGLSKCSAAGDVAMHSGKGSHIWIGLGDGNLAEANHTWKYFEHITKDSRSVKGKQNGAVYRCTKASPIKKGDRGTEVIKLQKFLNWAGFNCGSADGEFGDATHKAVKAFQSKTGLTADGIVGNGTLEKIKAYKK